MHGNRTSGYCAAVFSTNGRSALVTPSFRRVATTSVTDDVTGTRWRRRLGKNSASISQKGTTAAMGSRVEFVAGAVAVTAAGVGAGGGTGCRDTDGATPLDLMLYT